MKIQDGWELYMGGGLGSTEGPAYRDMALNSEKLDTWRSLPSCQSCEPLAGNENLNCFDLQTETWKFIGTTRLVDQRTCREQHTAASTI